MTVSRAINGRPGVGPELRLRVLETAASLGYRPSRVARGLACRRTSTLGIVLPDMANPFFAILAKAATDVARGCRQERLHHEYGRGSRPRAQGDRLPRGRGDRRRDNRGFPPPGRDSRRGRLEAGRGRARQPPERGAARGRGERRRSGPARSRPSPISSAEAAGASPSSPGRRPR